MKNFRIGIRRKKISNRLQDVSVQGATQPVVLMVPYGMFANPRTDTPLGIHADQGNEESLYGIPFEVKDLETLADGEVAFGIPGEDGRIIFKASGKIVFRDSNNEGGDFMARFNELKAGFDQLVSDFNLHAHTGVTTGAGTSGTPVAPSTASIDDAKIDDIEVPEK